MTEHRGEDKQRDDDGADERDAMPPEAPPHLVTPLGELFFGDRRHRNGLHDHEYFTRGSSQA